MRLEGGLLIGYQGDGSRGVELEGSESAGRNLSNWKKGNVGKERRQVLVWSARIHPRARRTTRRFDSRLDSLSFVPLRPSIRWPQ